MPPVPAYAPLPQATESPPPVVAAEIPPPPVAVPPTPMPLPIPPCSGNDEGGSPAGAVGSAGAADTAGAADVGGCVVAGVAVVAGLDRAPCGARGPTIPPVGSVRPPEVLPPTPALPIPPNGVRICD